MAKKKKATGRMANPRRGNRSPKSTAPESIVFEGKTYSRAEWTKAIKVGVKDSTGRVIVNAPVAMWQLHLKDPFGNDVWYGFPQTLRYFNGSELGPGWGSP